MRTFITKVLYGVNLFVSSISCGMARADEGMWLFNKLPKDQLQQKYGFEVTDQWAEHVRLSSVRFNSGGSASFISASGLVLTNHHVAADTLYKLSTEARNIANDGYLAREFSEELKAPDLELNQLVEIIDVTSEVNARVDGSLDTSAAALARRAVIADIEAKSKEESGLRSNVVTLYGGGEYHLYRYKQYTDVRLVWAPEAKIAFFGGDADNFEYPRHCLDVTIFRVYENDQPAVIKHFLKSNPSGACDGDLVFVSGNPGRTQRILTADALAYQRDHRMPKVLDYLRRKEIMLQQFGLAGKEERRRAQDDLFGIQNSRKAYSGMLAGLQDPAFFEQKRTFDQSLAQTISGSDPYATIRQVQTDRLQLTDRMSTLRSRIYGIAETLVLMAGEDEKPNSERLPEYRESNRESLEQELFSPAPLYDDLERTILADELARLMEERGGDDPLVLQVMHGKSPQALATEAVSATKLFDVDARRALAAGKMSAVNESSDPLIQIARILESEYRSVLEKTEQLDELERQAYATIADAKFKLQGDSVYPDATFSLRLAFGVVKGYEENGQFVAPYTTLGSSFGQFEKHEEKDDWKLPSSWLEAKDKLDQTVPFNFVCTADIIGGNSGSPVIDREGQIVGIIFDGNIQSLTADFYHSEEQGRAVAVHIGALLETLEKVYQAANLRSEIGR